MDEQQAIAALAALAQSTWLQSLKLLVSREPDDVRPGTRALCRCASEYPVGTSGRFERSDVEDEGIVSKEWRVPRS